MQPRCNGGNGPVDPAYFVAHVGVVWRAAHVLILVLALLALAVTP